MKPNLENLKEYTQKTSLSQEEKFAMLQEMRSYTNAHPIKTPYYSLFFKHSLAYASMFALIIGTSATSFAAESSLPGDILYPVKIEINEKIAQTLSITKTQKAKTNVKLVDKRMEELTKMVVTEKDTPEKIDIIVAQLEEHKQDLQEYIEQVEASDIEASKDAVAIYTELESVVDAHLDILENIAEDKKARSVLIDIFDTVDSIKIASTSINNNEDTTELLNISTTTEKISSEQEAILELLDFSAKLEPILIEARSKIQKESDEATSTRIRADVRKRIIEKAEKDIPSLNTIEE